MPVRYDGKGVALAHPQIKTWQNNNQLITFCPEVAGGLSTPRSPAEIYKQRVITNHGEDVTDAFIDGAHKALALCQSHTIRFALLKEFSPSCGRNKIYDGTHSEVKILGQGLTASLLLKNGIQVFSEEQMPALIKALALS